MDFTFQHVFYFQSYMCALWALFNTHQQTKVALSQYVF